MPCRSLAPGGWRAAGRRQKCFSIRLLPEVSGAAARHCLLRWGLLDTCLGVILAPLTMALPVAAWMLITTFNIMNLTPIFVL